MSQPWYRRFPDNFLGGINGMTLEEKGAYSVVIDMIYQRGGPIADEPRYIAGICNCSVRKWNAIRARLIDLGKLEAIDGQLMNRRAEEELEKAAKISREHAENGAKGGDKSAEMKAEAKKNNALDQARLKLTRASSTSTPFKKEGATRSDPTDGSSKVRLHSEDPVFRQIVRMRGNRHPPTDREGFWSFPPDEVVAAREAIEAQASIH